MVRGLGPGNQFTGNQAIQGFYDQRFSVVQQFFVQGARIVCLDDGHAFLQQNIPGIDRVLSEKVDTPDSARP